MYDQRVAAVLALYLNKNGGHKLFANKLFTVDGDIGIKKVWFSDTDPGCRIIAGYTDHAKPLGIDKKMAAQAAMKPGMKFCEVDKIVRHLPARRAGRAH